MLGIHFTDLYLLQRKLHRHIAEMNDKMCDEAKLRFAVLEEHIGNLRTVFDRIASEMKQLPETTWTTITY